MKKPVLFLHVGIPKTGSTALQIYFVNHAQQMLEQGLYYPDTNNSFSTAIELGLTSGNAHSLAIICQKFADNDDQLRLQTDQWIQKLIEESSEYSFKAVLLSCETFSTFTKRQWAILEELLNKYFDLRLIAYFREPYSWVFTTWLQVVKRDGAKGWLGVGEPQRDWLALILPQMLSDQLLKKTIQLSYEECKADIIGSFFKAINLPILHSNSNDKLTKTTTNRSLTDQELTLMLLINRLTNGDSSFCRQFTDTLIGQPVSPPCYFYSPEVDGMIDAFFIANGTKRQHLCTKLDPVVNSERSWIKKHTVDATLLESVFSKLAEYYNSRINALSYRAIKKANYYIYSIFRTQVPDKFDVMAYLSLNQDVLVAKIDPYKHYVQHGSAEGRRFDWGLLPINSETKNITQKRGVAIFAKDFSRLPARKISKKLRDRQCLRLPRSVLVTSFRPNKGSKHRFQMT